MLFGIIPAIYIGFWLSGFAAMIYEIVWMRFLQNAIGADAYSVSALLTVFIGGIACGTKLSGKLLTRFFSNPSKKALTHSYFLFLLFAIFQLVMAVYACLLPALSGEFFLGKILLFFAKYFLLSSSCAILIKFCCAIFLFIIPCILMGFSFPVLSEILTEKLPQSSSLSASNLYSANIFGAILGALCTGFWFLPKFGLNASNLIGACVNLFTSLSLLLLLIINHRKYQCPSFQELFSDLFVSNLKPLKISLRKPLSQEFKILAWFNFGLGFLLLALQVLWNKLLLLMLGSSTYSFTIILVSILFGIACGNYFLNFLVKIANQLKLDLFYIFKILIFILAFLIALSSSCVNILPNIFHALSSLPLALIKFLISLLLTLPVTLVQGLLFAMIIYFCTNHDIDDADKALIGAKISHLVFFNTLGSISGSFLMGYCLLPVFSLLGNALFLSSVLLIIFALFLGLFALKLPYGKISKKIIFVIVVVILLMLILMPRFDTTKLSTNLNIYKDSPKEKLLFYQEGLNSIISIVENLQLNAIFLKSNGKIEAGRPIDLSKPSGADMQTQILLAYLPFITQVKFDKALLIGMGSGISLESLSQIGDIFSLQKIDICEIESLIFKVVNKFFPISLSNSVQIDKHSIDARNFLYLNSTQYDLIISQPSDPWISSGLFTQEFWQIAATKLSQQGIFVQWLQLYAIEPKYLQSILKTFSSIFPNVMIVQSPRAAEIIVLGSRQPILLDKSKIEQIFAERKIKSKLLYLGIHDPFELVSLIIANLNHLQFPSDVPINTDDNMLIEFHTSKALSKFFDTIKSNQKLLKNLSKQAQVYSLDFFDKESRFDNCIQAIDAMKAIVEDESIADKFSRLEFIYLAQKSFLQKISLELDNELAYIYLAKMNLLIYPFTAKQQIYLDEARSLLERAQAMNPYNPHHYEVLSYLYLSQLPSSQLEFMKLLQSKSSQLLLLDRAIDALKHALELNPASVFANYQMARLQYIIGNLDNSYIHLKRLNKICRNSNFCEQELSDKEIQNLVRMTALMERLRNP